MNKFLLCFIVVTAFLVAEPAATQAFQEGDNVTGSFTFNGDATNYFDPINGLVPPGTTLNAAGSTVSISNSDIEFGCNASPDFIISADFTSSSQLVLEEIIDHGSVANQMTFTGLVPGEFTSITQSSSTFPDGSTSYSVSNNTITFDFTGTGGFTNDFYDYRAVFDVPEPSTWMLLGLGTGGMLLVGRRRLS